jgi:hypothetical protein
MGLELTVTTATPPSLARIITAFADAKLTCMLVMVDNRMLTPGAAPPDSWSDARFRFMAGTVTIVRRPTGLAVVVFGNADAALQEAQRTVAEVLTRLS